jgi:hypothetical protein
MVASIPQNSGMKQTVKRGRFVTVRLSDREHEAVDAAAEAAGMSVSAWLRYVGLRAAQGQPASNGGNVSSGLSASDLKSLITLLKKLEPD